jgi:hypothetical protein
MPYKLLCFFALLLSLNIARAQGNYSVKGGVTDSTSTPLEGANVRIISGTDTLKVTSNTKGSFSISGIKQKNFQLKVSYLGYLDFLKNVTAPDDGEEITLAPIVLKLDSKNLKEVVIKSKVPPIVLKKDTIEYNVASYNINDQEMVQELLKRLPGLVVDKDGNLTSEGKPVTKLRVNGKDFFTGNIQEFIRQLPTGILSKVQIVNDYGDDANFTGIKKGSTQTLNLVTKPGMDNGIFGSLSAIGGTNGQRGAGLSNNFWKSSRQISGSGNFRTAKNTLGSNIYNNLGFSYGDELAKKLNMSTSYSYTNSRGSAQNSTFSETVNSIGKINNDVNSTSEWRNSQHNLNANLSYNPDNKTYLRFDSYLTFSRASDSSFSDAQQTGVIKQGLVTGNSGTTKAPRTSVNLTVGLNFSETNRLTANIQFSTDNTTSQHQINRNIRYYDTLGTFKKDSIFNSLVTNTGRSQNISVSIIYTKALSKKSNLDLTYSFNGTTQRTVLETDLIQPPKGLTKIDSLSNNLSNTLSTNRLDLNYRWEGTKLSMTNGLSIQRNAISGLYEGRTDRVSNSTFNLSPVFNLSYSPSIQNQLSMGYSGYSNSPSIDQLQPVRDTRNLQNVIIGNPDLKPSFTHNLSSNFRHSSPKGQLISFAVSTSFTQNQIISNTIIEKDTLNSLKQVTTYLNASGSNNITGYYDWTIPITIGKTKLNVNYSGSAALARQLVYTDNVKSFNNSRSISQSVRTMLMLKKFSSDAGVTYTQSYNHYTVGQGLSSTISQLTINLGEHLNISNSNSINVDVSKGFVHGYTNINAGNPFIVNASAEQRFFNNKLFLRLQASDIFNQSNRVSQQVSGNSIVNNRSNYITRYVTFSCIYSISKFGIFKKGE